MIRVGSRAAQPSYEEGCAEVFAGCSGKGQVLIRVHDGTLSSDCLAQHEDDG
jgi:hypothetical protein